MTLFIIATCVILFDREPPSRIQQWILYSLVKGGLSWLFGLPNLIIQLHIFDIVDGETCLAEAFKVLVNRLEGFRSVKNM